MQLSRGEIDLIRRLLVEKLAPYLIIIFGTAISDDPAKRQLIWQCMLWPKKKPGLPQSSRDAFKLLNQQGIIDDLLVLRLEAMVGFRNIAIHDYQSINLVIVKNIEEHLKDFELFTEKILTC